MDLTCSGKYPPYKNKMTATIDSAIAHQAKMSAREESTHSMDLVFGS